MRVQDSPSVDIRDESLMSVGIQQMLVALASIDIQQRLMVGIQQRLQSSSMLMDTVLNRRDTMVPLLHSVGHTCSAR